MVLEHESKKTQKEYEAKNKEIAEKRSRLQDQINAITAEINRLTPCCRGLKRGKYRARARQLSGTKLQGWLFNTNVDFFHQCDSIGV